MYQENNKITLETCPLVSVSIPSYNAASTLSETLDCVLAQTYPSVEVIVVDDGSTDDTQAVLKRYAPRVRAITKPNGGLASARNAACQAALGKYIALLDADDLCIPERIAVQVAYMEQHPDVVLCSSDFIAFNRNGLVPDFNISNYYSQILDTPGGFSGLYPHHEKLRISGAEVTTYHGNVYAKMVVGSFIHPPTVLFRRSALDKCGLWDEQISNACDFDWLVRMSRIGEFGFIAHPLLKYRFSDNQMSGLRNRIQISLDIVEIMEKAFAADPMLFRNNRKLFRSYLGNAYLDAANALVDDQPLAAITKLMRSVSFGVVRLQTLKVICKAFIPIGVIKWRRQLR